MIKEDTAFFSGEQWWDYDQNNAKGMQQLDLDISTEEDK